jgi:exodeoxyribonuclease VII small subunit
MSADGGIAALTYEQALAELDTLIQRLEGGAVNLDEAIACYERASLLAQHCAELLDRTEQKITQLVVGPAGPQERAFSPEAVPAAVAAGAAAPGSASPPVEPATERRPPDAHGFTVPPPPSAPLRARPVRPAPPASPPLPGLEPSPAEGRGADDDVDLDDIPF